MTGTMHSLVWLRAPAILLLLIVVNSSLQQQIYAAAQGNAFELHVRPRICVLLAAEANCSMQLAVSWSAPEASDVCLKLAHATAALRCWEQQSGGELEIALQRDSNTVVQLLDAASNAVLSETEVTIVSRDLRDSRRRRRHVWSII